MSFNIDLGGEFAVTQNLDKLARRDETGGNEVGYRHFLKLLGICHSLNDVQIDSFVFNAVDILEAELRNTALQRHLTTFETNLLGITRTLLSTLMTTS